jgi:hypothetical protein
MLSRFVLLENVSEKSIKFLGIFSEFPDFSLKYDGFSEEESVKISILKMIRPHSLTCEILR